MKDMKCKTIDHIPSFVYNIINYFTYIVKRLLFQSFLWFLVCFSFTWSYCLFKYTPLCRTFQYLSNNMLHDIFWWRNEDVMVYIVHEIHCLKTCAVLFNNTRIIRRIRMIRTATSPKGSYHAAMSNSDPIGHIWRACTF